MLTDKQDAFGHLLTDYHNGEENVEIVEREDGYIDISRLGPLTYFAEYTEWVEHQKLAMKYATGRVLDIGCGAGRHSLHLQEKGHDVFATDISPLAIQLCQHRGLKKRRCCADYTTQFQTGCFQYDHHDGTQFWTCWQL